MLTSPERRALFKDFMEEASSRWERLGLGKADLKAAVDGIDDWVEANAASYNAAIPQPARGALSIQQKVRLLFYVVKKRFEVA